METEEADQAESHGSPSLPGPPLKAVPSDKRATFRDVDEDALPAKAGTPPRALSRARSSASLLADIPSSKQYKVVMEDVGAWVPIMVQSAQSAEPAPSLISRLKARVGLGGSSSSSSGQPKEKQVLYNITACVEPGEVLALMGPSGSGKTSLISLLGGRSMARTEGNMLFGGRKLDKPMKRKLGFVTQDDLLFGELTVYETLYFAARLRLPRVMPLQEKLDRVEVVLEGLGLSKCRDTIVGNQMMRGVSGGERKRVSIGHELLINPSILLLDEPTSGLDSTTALKLMHTLRTLAHGGRTIITSIHQPASRLYQKMDKLMLLSEGHLMFYGGAGTALAWFKQVGQPCPYGVNIADHMLDLACGTPPGLDNPSPEAGAEVRLKLVEAFEKRNIGMGLRGVHSIDLDQAAEVIDNALFEQKERQLLLQSSSKRQQEEEVEEAAGSSKWGASWFEQLGLLLVRSIKVRRFRALSTELIGQQVAIALLAGLFWWQAGRNLNKQHVTDLGGLLFFMQLFMAFATLFAALFTFPLEFSMLVKERQSGMYRLSAYYVSRTLADLPMDCLIPTLFTWIIYWMAWIRPSAGAFFATWWSILLISQTAQSLGLLIGANFTNLITGQSVASVFMLSTMLVGGYYVQGVPSWISWLKYLSIIYYGWDLLLKIAFSNRGYPCSDILANNNTAASVAPGQTYCDVAQANLFKADVNSAVTEQVLVLLAMFFGLRMITYWSLNKKTTFKTKA